MIEKARQDLRSKHQIKRQKKINQSGRSKRSLHESQGEPRGERDVIRLRNPTEDKRAFRRMLTSADRLAQARVPGKKADYSAHRGLNLPNRGINFIPRLDFVPEKHD